MAAFVLPHSWQYAEDGGQDQTQYEMGRLYKHCFLLHPLDPVLHHALGGQPMTWASQSQATKNKATTQQK